MLIMLLLFYASNHNSVHTSYNYLLIQCVSPCQSFGRLLILKVVLSDLDPLPPTRPPLALLNSEALVLINLSLILSQLMECSLVATCAYQ